MLTILMFGGTLGNMLSTVMTPYSIGVGASSSVFAVLGVVCVWTALNYQNFGGQKGRVVIILLILNGITLLASFFQANADVWAHLGGLVAGIPLGILFVEPGS
jgi:rhomboid protease GluP